MEKEIKALQNIKDASQRRMMFLGLITDILKDKDIDLILVGGQAAAFYTLGSYTTEDMDIVSNDSNAVSKLLEELKFEKTGRIWYNEEINIAIDLVSPYFTGSKEKLREVELENRYIKVIGVEDLIIDRLISYIQWKVERDGLVAKQLILLHYDDIDWEYLEGRAKKESVINELKIMKNELRELREKG
ncbi:MAG: DUF6036 family nucleotidyltransferase [Candidatus Hodarchaeota archaeon]